MFCEITIDANYPQRDFHTMYVGNDLLGLHLNIGQFKPFQHVSVTKFPIIIKSQSTIAMLWDIFCIFALKNKLLQ